MKEKIVVAFFVAAIFASCIFMAARCSEGSELQCPKGTKLWIKDAFGYPKAICIP
jgi:hypothetical protein